MDKKINKDSVNEDYDNELLDFLDDDTYLVFDNETGIVGNKKTGIMIDKRSGRVFSEKSKGNVVGNSVPDNGLKYDFLDYKKSVDILNSSNILENSEQRIETERRVRNNRNFKLKNYLMNNLQNKKVVSREFENQVNDKDKVKNIEGYVDVFDKQDNFNNVSLVDIDSQTDDEILNRINEKFKSAEGDFGDFKNGNSSHSYDFASFEEDNLEKEKKNVDEEVNLINQLRFKDLDRFKTIIDFEEYLCSMPDEEDVLKSPFDSMENYEAPKILVEDNSENDDSFMPFDVLPDFEVEEIQSYDVNPEDVIKDGIIPDLNLNQGVSKKVSIREVIKNKQKKKQEQKELQEKLFFETIDERIEQFKKIKEHSIDSQDILNAINMDLNKINSSIRIEFESLNKKRKVSKNQSNGKESPNKNDKFSLQSLLEEIYEENGESKSSLDVNELDIDSIKRDLARKESEKNIVN